MSSPEIRAAQIAKELREELDFDAAINLLAAHMVALEDTHANLKTLVAISEKLGFDLMAQCLKTVDIANEAQICAQIGAKSTEFRIADGIKNKKRKMNAVTARHAENHAKKNETFKWLDANFARDGLKNSVSSVLLQPEFSSHAISSGLG